MQGIFQLLVALTFVASVVDACGGGSRKCTYSTCYTSWGAWSPLPSQGQCVRQRSVPNHIYQSHSQSGSCPSSTRCTTTDRWQYGCSCREVYHCSWGSWSSWQSAVSRGTCATQRRYRPNHQTIRYVNRVGSCNGVPTNCDRGNQEVESRTWCSCKKVVSCPLLSWTSWSPGVPSGRCSDQTRYQDYNPSFTYVDQQNNCNGISTNCPSRTIDRRTYCMCQFLQCTLNDWGPWKEIPGSASCPLEERFQLYSGSPRYKGALSNCDNVYPKSCPGPGRQERKKDVKCPKFDPISDTDFVNEACNGDKSSCGATCQIRCSKKGYDVANAQFVTCLGTGKWSGQLGYCNDTELPEVMCPEPIVQNNDPNKDFAMVDLLDAKATDNSGKSPDIAISHKSPVKVKVGEKIKITYTATDSNRNSRHCASEITAKDVEPPKVTFCPKEVIVQVTKFPHSVIWEEPTFTDNVDKEVSRTSTHQNGQQFSRGKYRVKYVANDKAFNQVTCEFDVQVTPIRCEEHVPPNHGAVSCNIRKAGFKELYVCSPACKAGFWFINDNAGPKSFDYYVCGEDGTWRGLTEYDMDQQSQTGLFTNIITRGKVPWPNCAEGTPPEAVKKTYKILAGSCKDAKAVEELKKNLVAKLKSDLLVYWLYCQPDKNNCAVENVQVKCASRMRRGVVVNEMEITLTLKVADPNPGGDQSAALKKLNDIKAKLTSLESTLTKSVAATTKSSSVNVEKKEDSLACRSGKAFSEVSGSGSADERAKCVLCPVGTYLNKESASCVHCPVGSYQDSDGKEECIKCPAGKSTHGHQASNFTACKDICNPGTYSSTGLATCLACPKGSYQPAKNRTRCIECPAGFGTDKPGSSSESDCTKQALNILLRSEGCEDPGAVGCGKASIKVNNQEYSPARRGYNIVVLDARTGQMESARSFDSHCCKNQGTDLASFINGLPNDKIVLVAIQDDASLNYVNEIFSALSKIGGREPFQREYRASYALAGYKGTTKVTWIQQLSRPRGRGPSEIKLAVPLLK